MSSTPAAIRTPPKRKSPRPQLFEGEKATRSKILRAALELFATRGFAATSLREITESAQVNVAAIHYHFGSKEELVREVMRAVSGPLNQLRLEALENAARPLSIESVVHALIAPAVMLSFEATGQWRLLIRLLVQVRVLPQEATNHAVFEQYDDLALRFVDAMLEADPQLQREEAFWRYAFAIGAMMYIVSDTDQGYHRLHRLSGGLCDTDDPQAITAQLTAFISAGMRAARPTTTTETPETSP
jgi:AcrR family transcriptional regulator